MSQDLWQPIHFDRELIAKYDRPGPRYTSYPTAPQLSEELGPADYAHLLEASATEHPKPLSLYVHVPFCSHRCFFCGCNVTISHDRSWGRRYLPWLAREMEKAAALAEASRRKVAQIHWGGGTPTFFPAEDLAELAALLRHNFVLAPDAEFGVEVDPREFSRAQLDALAAAGCNRISLGVQDLSPQVQRAVNRVQSPELTWTVLEAARARGIESVNVDLIYGLPHQTPESFAATVDEVIRMSPDRLALFNFAYLPATFRHQRTIDPEALPEPAAKLRLLEETTARLGEAGYVFIGMDHFAKPTDPLAQALRQRTLTRNFQGYSTCAETDLLGFGVSAISEVAGGLAQNEKTLGGYSAALLKDRFATARGLVTSADDRLRRTVIMGLMCHFELDKRDVERRFGLDFDRYFASELAALAPLAEDGLIELSPSRIEVTPIGRLLVRNVAMPFDAYLGRSAVRYSRTV